MHMKLKHLFLLALMVVLATNLSRAENYPYRSDVLWVTVPDHDDWLYQTGQQARVEVEFYKYGIPRDATVAYELAPDMLAPTRKGEVRLRHGRATINMGTMREPGFLDCRMTATVDGTKYTHHVKVGFSVDRLEPYTKMPDDFDEFWRKNVDENRKTPLDYTMRKVEKYSDDEIDCYLVKMRVDSEGHSVYAYLTRPKAPGSYPAVLCPPGAGIKTIREPMKRTYYARNGFIRMEMEIHGLNPEMTDEQFDEISKAFNTKANSYLNFNLDNRDNYYMKHVYLACSKAVDLLASLPDWDGRNMAVQGGSQGGALSIVTAALNPKVTLCVANHPALSDMARYAAGKTGGYPHYNRTPGMLTKEKIKTMAYYDVINFARRMTCPVYMTWGYNDATCPPTTSYIVWNVIKSPKECLLTPINEHWTSDQTDYDQMVYIKKHLEK